MSGEFSGYTSSFIKDSHGMLQPSDLDGAEIVFKELEYSHEKGGVIGYCYAHVPLITEGFRVEIDPQWWSSHSELDRWQLMYHELAHCLCGLDHTAQVSRVGEVFISVLEQAGIKTNRQDWLPGKCEKSIMDPYTLDEACIKRHKEYYTREIFSKCQPVLPNSFWIEKSR